MRRFGIKKTKGNIILLFVVGLLVGVVIGLRQPAPEVKMPIAAEAIVVESSVQ